MKLIVDIGNTSIKIATVQGEMFSFAMHIDHQGKGLKDKDEERLVTFLQEGLFSDAYIASVQPTILTNLVHILKKVNIPHIHLLNRHNFPSLKIDIDNPDQLGIDLIADAVAVSQQYNGLTIVVDVGTSTKILAVHKHTFLGVSIAPGIYTSYKALIGSASLLEDILLSAPTLVYGKNTETSILSGVILGHVSMIGALIEKGRLELPSDESITYVMTGGYAHLIIPYLNLNFIEEPYLTLKGIKVITK
jgi:type III pantothenate kinase